MNGMSEVEIWDGSRFRVFPELPGDRLLSAVRVSQRLAYTPAQLFLLTRKHGLPLPFDYARGLALWRVDEAE
jgi:hypothetical protein